MGVRHDLHFDMPGRGHELFDVDGIVSKGGPGFGARRLKRLIEVCGRFSGLHATPAASGGRLDQHGKSSVHRDSVGISDRVHRAVRTGNHGNAQLLHRGFGQNLVAHGPDVLGLGADERDPVLFDDRRKACVLGEEAVPRVNGVGTRDLGRRYDGGNVQVALARFRWADANRLVSETDVHRLRVGGRMHGDRADAHLPAGTVNAECDFSTIRDQDLVEHLR